MDGLLSRQGVIDTAFASLTTKPHLTQDQQALIQDILTDIRIYGQPHFDVTAFTTDAQLSEPGAVQGGRGADYPDRLREVFRISSIDEFRALLANEPMLVLPECPDNKLTLEAFFWRDEYFNSQGPDALLSYLFSPEQIQRYLNVRAEFEYKGKTVEKLSAGQRGPSMSALNWRQMPSDRRLYLISRKMTDNDFIMHSLVPLFRKIKQYRQVIIVTHNANRWLTVMLNRSSSRPIMMKSSVTVAGRWNTEITGRQTVCARQYVMCLKGTTGARSA